MRATMGFNFPKNELQRFDATCKLLYRMFSEEQRKPFEAACQEVLGESKGTGTEELTVTDECCYEGIAKSDTATPLAKGMRANHGLWRK